MQDEIMVIRPTAQVGGDCCGGIADDDFICMSEVFAEVREEMSQLGQIYRHIQQTYGKRIAITYLDPRNHFAIIAYLLRCWRSGHIRFHEGLRSLFSGVRRGAFFYNGHWLNPDQTMDETVILNQVKKIRTRRGL